MLSLTEIRYWYNNQTPEKQKEIQETIEFEQSELQGNSVFEQIRDVYSDEVKAWFDGE